MPLPGPPSEFKAVRLPRLNSGLAAIPSWLISLVLHGALFLALAATLPGLRGGIVGDPDGDFRKIGIYVGRSGGTGDGSHQGAGKKDRDPPSRPQSAPLSDSTQAKTAPVAPQPNLQPTPKPEPVIGPGGAARKSDLPAASPPPPPAPTAGESVDRAPAGGKSRGNGAGGRGSFGSTPFFGIWDAGAKFVYVIDCSGSMFGHNAMQAAKNELQSSLGTLKRSQQFQIVFYNLNQRWLNAPGKTDFRYFAATQANCRLASQFVAQVQPDDGTDHLPPLKLALRLHPDVIFFLTDAGKPGLSPSELEEIHRLNGGRTRIHCVQFDSDDESDLPAATSFMRTLAAQNDGDFVYRNVSRFDAPLPIKKADVHPPSSSSGR